MARGPSTLLSWPRVVDVLLVGIGRPAMEALPMEKVPVWAVLPVLWSTASQCSPDNEMPPGRVRALRSVEAPACRAPLIRPDQAVLVPPPRLNSPATDTGAEV